MGYDMVSALLHYADGPEHCGEGYEVLVELSNGVAYQGAIYALKQGDTHIRMENIRPERNSDPEPLLFIALCHVVTARVVWL